MKPKLRIKKVTAKHGQELQVVFEKQDGADWFTSSIQILQYPNNVDSLLEKLGTIADKAYGTAFGFPRVYSIEMFYYKAEKAQGKLASLEKVKAVVEVDNHAHKKERQNLSAIEQKYASDAILSPEWLTKDECKHLQTLCNLLGESVSEELVRESQCEPVQMSLTFPVLKAVKTNVEVAA